MSIVHLENLGESIEEVLLNNEVIKDNEIIIDKTDAFVSQLMLIFVYSMFSCIIQIVGYFLYNIVYLRLLTNGHKINLILAGDKTTIRNVIKKTE